MMALHVYRTPIIKFNNMKRIVIMGASSGIGLAVAEAFASRG